MSTSCQTRPPVSKERHITYKELKQHSTYSDAWISINSIVYDITHFIDRHPFGDTFRGHLGTECGGLFSSAHTNTKVEEWLKRDSFLKENGIKRIGRLDASGDKLHKRNERRYLDRIVYKDMNEDEFWQDLKHSVSLYLKKSRENTHYTFREGVLLLCYYLGIHFCLSYLTWVHGSLLAAMLMGLHSVCMMAYIAHMAAHSGFTKSPLLDFIAMHIFDLVGMSGLEWQITHQTHHHQPHSFLDYMANTTPWVGVRIHKYMKRHAYHRFQYIYYWFTVSFYIVLRLVVTTIWLVLRKELMRNKYDFVAHIFVKGFLLLEVMYCFHLHGLWMGLAIFAMYTMTTSQVAFLLLFNEHEETHFLLGESDDVSNYHKKLSWAEVQVRTSSNWYPTNWFMTFIEFHSGYFNFHIEHHLFPTFKPHLLRKISPIVKGVCAKHGVTHLTTSFLEVQKSLQGHLINLSRD